MGPVPSVFGGVCPDVSYHRLLRRAWFLGLSQNAVAAARPATTPNANAAAKSKPLNIIQFMREQAASTRAAKPRQSKVQPVAQAQRPARRVVAARPKPAGLPVEAAASYASQQPTVQVVASDELNDIDRAAAATVASAETTGAAIAAEPNVQLVETGEFNDIDRKAEGGQPVRPPRREVADAHAASRPRRRVLAAMDLVGGGRHLRRAGNRSASTRRPVTEAS